jgi:protein gp37
MASATQQLLPSLARQINAAHEAAVGSARDAIEHTIEVGNLLIEAKTKVKHGEWQDWVETNCQFSYRMCAKYMGVAKSASRGTFGDDRPKSLRQALEMLSESVAEARNGVVEEPEPEETKSEDDIIIGEDGNKETGEAEEAETEIDESEEESESESEEEVYSLNGNAEPAKRHTFNETNDKVDWAKWTWNPVTGCKHDCVYCYARDIANRFYPEKFEPTFHAEKLACPKDTKLPGKVDLVTDPVELTSWRNVFVCSMADLFGRWVPDQWIEDVFAACCDSPQWNYLFLTKFPNRYVGLDFPKNSWVGTSVDEQKRVANAEKSFAKIKAEVKWLSVEPMRERITFKNLSVFNWVVIGGQSKSSGAPEFFPENHWVNDLIHDAHAAGCKVFCKPNTDPMRHWSSLFREYPDAFGAKP